MTRPSSIFFHAMDNGSNQPPRNQAQLTETFRIKNRGGESTLCVGPIGERILDEGKPSWHTAHPRSRRTLSHEIHRVKGVDGLNGGLRRVLKRVFQSCYGQARRVPTSPGIKGLQPVTVALTGTLGSSRVTIPKGKRASNRAGAEPGKPVRFPASAVAGSRIAKQLPRRHRPLHACQWLLTEDRDRGKDTGFVKDVGMVP